MQVGAPTHSLSWSTNSHHITTCYGLKCNEEKFCCVQLHPLGRRECVVCRKFWSGKRYSRFVHSPPGVAISFGFLLWAAACDRFCSCVQRILQLQYHQRMRTAFPQFLWLQSGLWAFPLSVCIHGGLFVNIVGNYDWHTCLFVKGSLQEPIKLTSLPVYLIMREVNSCQMQHLSFHTYV